MRMSLSDKGEDTAGSICSVLERAGSLYAMGRCDEAVGILAKALEANPLQPVLASRMAELLIDSGEYSTALKFLQAAEPGESSNSRLYLKAVCLEALGDDASAGAAAKRMLSIEGQGAPARVIQARMALRSGAQDLAQALFEEAAALDPECGTAWFGLGTIHRQRGCASESLRYFEKALRVSPGSREIALALHETALSTGGYPRAESAIRQALDRQPINRRLRFLLIDVLLRQGKPEAAMSDIESALVDFGIDDGLLAAALSVRKQIGVQRTINGDRTAAAVSLCVIVKNEEKHLARCLQSAKPVVHEMIVVDTGSTDRTRQIATAFGARVFDFEWVDDFSKARNFSLAQASGDWILVLDADEALSPRSYDAFRSLVRLRPVKPVAYSIRTRNYTHNCSTLGWTANLNEFPEEEGSGWFASDKARLFPNDPRIRFTDPVHELVEPSLRKLGVEIKTCPAIPVHHFGYLSEAKASDKTRKYLDLGRKKLKKNRRNLSALKEMAIQSANVGDHEKALRLWKQFLSLQPDSAEASLNSGSACWHLGRYPEAVQWADKALRLDPSMREGALNKAVAFLMMGRAQESMSILSHVLEKHPVYPPAQFMFCVACACAGESGPLEVAVEKLKSTQLGPYLGESFFEISKRLLTASKTDYARKTIEAAIRFECATNELVNLLQDRQIAE
jgi:tetratricopeptide (TPR) repeat protein